MGRAEEDRQEVTEDDDKRVRYSTMAGGNEPETSIKVVYARKAEY